MKFRALCECRIDTKHGLKTNHVCGVIVEGNGDLDTRSFQNEKATR